MSNNLGTRTDCRRDNRVTLLPNSTWLGTSTGKAKRGSWVHYEQDGYHHAARVVGRVHCEGKTFLEVIAMDTAMTMAYVRWIEPASVRACYSGPHKRVIDFMTGDWADAEAILTRVSQGFVRAELLG
jgi:hypothetical protein